MGAYRANPVLLMNPEMIHERPDTKAQLDNCRNLIRILSFAIDTICREYDGDEQKIVHLRDLIASLSILNSITATMDIRLPYSGELPFFDANDCYLELNSTRARDMI
jgi:hypothetical protein